MRPRTGSRTSFQPMRIQLFTSCCPVHTTKVCGYGISGYHSRYSYLFIFVRYHSVFLRPGAGSSAWASRYAEVSVHGVQPPNAGRSNRTRSLTFHTVQFILTVLGSYCLIQQYRAQSLNHTSEARRWDREAKGRHASHQPTRIRHYEIGKTSMVRRRLGLFRPLSK